jgi:hypothetical protein
MKLPSTIGEIVDLRPADPIPTRGLCVRDHAVYEDGKLLGAEITRELVIEHGGDFERVYYKPIQEIVAASKPAGPVVDYCSYPRHRPSDWTADDGPRCGICHPPARTTP